jgi:membrane-associated protease RseP (regulator of RpoE activity)
MNKNVGGIDRILRIVVGLVVLATVWIVPTPWGWLGLIPLLTGLLNFCPLYTLLGVNTCSSK